MIRRVSGELIEVLEESAVVRTEAGVSYEVQVGGYAIPELRALMGAREAVELHTHYYIEGNVTTGQLLPRLVGFLSAEEREFFLHFIKVPGLSPKSGIRALGLPPQTIAEAVASANSAILTKLPGIGKKKADQIISQLQEKIAALALAPMAPVLDPARPAAPPQRAEAMTVLVGQLGYRTPEAEDLVERAAAGLDEDADTETILQEVFRLSR